MTSPITAEARAKRLLPDLMDMIFHDGASLGEMEAFIASAIREAEDAALERAADVVRTELEAIKRIISDEVDVEESAGAKAAVAQVGLLIFDFARECEADIRSLKSTKETGHE